MSHVAFALPPRGLELDAVRRALCATTGGDVHGEAMRGSRRCIFRSPAPLPRTVDVGGTTVRLYHEAPAPYSVVDTERRAMAAASPVFVVGAGGLGCELLKDLVLAGFRAITVVDLDTIDSTNLNRQFLFRPHHVGQPKSVVARESVLRWAPEAEVTALYGNIKAAEYDVAFFQRFAIVINGLDNVSARKHVNRMCMQAGVPLVESGTQGFNGQAQPMVKGHSECYDCSPRRADQQSFAVCTIHARPTTMVHCAHYAKELYGRLFGGDAPQAGEGQPADEFGFVAEALGGQRLEEAAAALFHALFVAKVDELLQLKQGTWTITPPAPLSGDMDPAPPRLSHDALPSVPQLRALFLQTTALLARRPPSPFTKDDDDACAFVGAVANLRAAVFHIDRRSLHDVKTIAGNIVPAIASTNATVSAAAVGQALLVLLGRHATHARHIAVSHVARRHLRETRGPGGRKVRDLQLIQAPPTQAPSPGCLVCSTDRHAITVTCNAAKHTLGSFVRRCLMDQLSLVAPTVDAGASTLYEHEDFEDLAARPLASWVTTEAPAAWTVTDLHQSLEWLVAVRHDWTLDETAFDVAGRAPTAAAPQGVAAVAATTEGPAAGGADDDDDVVDYHPARKRQALEGPKGGPKGGPSATADVVDISDDE